MLCGQAVLIPGNYNGISSETPCYLLPFICNTGIYKLDQPLPQGRHSCICIINTFRAPDPKLKLHSPN